MFKLIKNGLLIILTIIFSLLVLLLLFLNSPTLFNFGMDKLSSTNKLWLEVSDIDFSIVDLSFELDDLVIYNDASKKTAFIKSKKVKIAIGYAFLLTDEKIIDNIFLDKTHISLIQDKSGNFLWSFFRETSSENELESEEVSTTKSKEAPQSNSKIGVKNFTVIDSFFQYENQASPLGITLNDLNIQVNDWQLDKLTTVQIKAYTHYYSGLNDSFFVRGLLDGSIGIWFQTYISQLRTDFDFAVDTFEASFLKSPIKNGHLKLNFVNDFKNSEFRWDQGTLTWGKDNLLHVRGKVSPRNPRGLVDTTYYYKSSNLNDLLQLFNFKLNYTLGPEIYGTFRYSSKESGLFIDWVSLKLNRSKFLIRAFMKGLGESTPPEFAFKISGAGEKSNFKNFKLDLVRSNTEFKIGGSSSGNFENFLVQAPQIQIGETTINIKTKQTTIGKNLTSVFDIGLDSKNFDELLAWFNFDPIKLITKLKVDLSGKLDIVKQSFTISAFKLIADDYLLNASFKMSNWEMLESLLARISLVSNQSKKEILNLSIDPKTKGILNIAGWFYNRHVEAKLLSQLDVAIPKRIRYLTDLDLHVLDSNQLLSKLYKLTMPSQEPPRLGFNQFKLKINAQGDDKSLKLAKLMANFDDSVLSVNDASFHWQGEKYITALAQLEKIDIYKFISTLNEAPLNKNLAASNSLQNSTKLSPTFPPSPKKEYKAKTLFPEDLKNFLKDYKIDIKLTANDLALKNYLLPDLELRITTKKMPQPSLWLDLELQDRLERTILLDTKAHIDFSPNHENYYLSIKSPKLDIASTQNSSSQAAQNLAGYSQLKVELRTKGVAAQELIDNLALEGLVKLDSFSIKDTNSNRYLKADLDLRLGFAKNLLDLSLNKLNYQSQNLLLSLDSFAIEKLALNWPLNNYNAEKIGFSRLTIAALPNLFKEADSDLSQTTLNEAKNDSDSFRSLAGSQKLIADFFRDLPSVKIKQTDFGDIDIWYTANSKSSAKYWHFPFKNWKNVGVGQSFMLDLDALYFETDFIPKKNHAFEFSYIDILDSYPKITDLNSFMFAIQYAGNFEISSSKLKLSEQKIVVKKRDKGQSNGEILGRLNFKNLTSFVPQLKSSSIINISIPNYGPILDLYSDGHNLENFPIDLGLNMEIDHARLKLKNNYIASDKAKLLLNGNVKFSQKELIPSQISINLEASAVDEKIKSFLEAHNILLPTHKTLEPLNANFLLNRNEKKLSSNLKASVGKTNLVSKLLTKNEQDYVFDLEIDKLLLDDWIKKDDVKQADSNSSNDGTINSSGNQFKTEPILPLDALRKTNLIANVKLKNLVWHGKSINNIKTNLKLQDSIFELTNFDFDQKEAGRLRSSAIINMKPDKPLWQLHTKLTSLDLADLNFFISGKEQFFGKINFDFKGTAIGNNINLIKDSVNARANLNVSRVLLPKLPLKAAAFFIASGSHLHELINILNKRNDTFIGSEEASMIEYLESSLVFQEGKIILDKALNTSIPPLSVFSTDGYLDLDNFYLKLNLILSAADNANHVEEPSLLLNQEASLRVICDGYLESDVDWNFCWPSNNDLAIKAPEFFYTLINPLEWIYNLFLYLSE